MKKRNFLLSIFTFIFLFITFWVNAASYDTLEDVDKWTFNEYRYYLTRDYLKLKNNFEVSLNNWDDLIDRKILDSIAKNVIAGYKYLPVTLKNENILNNFYIAYEKGKDSPNSEVVYKEIVDSIESYIEDVFIYKIKWSLSATPKSWNAPLNVTLRAVSMSDESKNIIPQENYVWWILEPGSVKKVIWKWTAINYTFREDWVFAVTLDVTSASKNKYGNTDVIPFSASTNITVQEKIANVIVTANDYLLWDDDEVKFTPEEWSYWIIFDATSSIPTWWAKFTKTEWDFWNWVKRSYSGSPEIERVIYSREGSYNVKLTLKTNEWNTIKETFEIVVNNPIAVITANKTEWYIWEQFDFQSKTNLKNRNFSYTWQVSDEDWKVLKKHTWTKFSYSFDNKWKFVIKLTSEDAAWNTDYDQEYIYINSRAPIANFNYSFPDSAKPNQILLNATSTYDMDHIDLWKLSYKWSVDWEEIKLENPLNDMWSIWYYTFDSIWEHKILLQVTDPDWMTGNTTQNININSLLSVDFSVLPSVSRIWNTVNFKAISSKAVYFEWSFWDGNNDIWAKKSVGHKYEKSWKQFVKLTVSDKDWNSNSITKPVYIVDANYPIADIDINFWNYQKATYSPNACWWKWAYIVDRTWNITFSWINSVNVDGTNSWLDYSWSFRNKLTSYQDLIYKFDELWCFPLKLTVTSQKTWKTNSELIYIQVKNIKPTISGLQMDIENPESDPVVVNVTAVWAQDLDWGIQSYLWYYYTDIDRESQDFRITNGQLNNSTRFVLPKLPGNYNFVVVMTDTNWETVSSEEALNQKYSLSLDWDNINTPIIDFKSNKNNITIWSEIIFTNRVKNILWQDITNSAEYAFDFDWDWFYDLESEEPSTTYTYLTPGVYRPKVRVKHKWMTNVRNLEINVENVLTPDLKYISIWNKFLFFNTTKGQYTKTVLDYWNGPKEMDNDALIVDFNWDSVPETVTMKIIDWTSIKDYSIPVERNNVNLVDSKQAQWMVIYSYPEVSDDKIILKTEEDKLFIYLWDSKWAFKYAIDEDINYDSNLNGSKDDDIDNLNSNSYLEWSIYQIKLNEEWTQTIRVYTLDEEDNLLNSKDIVIQKTYIQWEENLSLDVEFEKASQEDLVKIEKLKSFISNFPQENRLEWMKYLNQLKEEWNFPAEKTKVIIAFEWFIFDNQENIVWADEIIQLLESFLLWETTGGLKDKAYNVINNLIPEELKLENTFIVENLDLIKANESDVEWNKVLAKEVLDAIKDTSLIDNSDKLTIRSQIQVLIYWDVESIPTEIKNEVKKQSNAGNLAKIWKITFVIITGLFFMIFIVLFWLFVYFKTTNENENQGFQDFLIELFDWSKKTSSSDVLLNDDFSIADELEEENKEENKIEEPKKEEKKTPETKKETELKEEKIPAWLSQNAENKKKEVKNTENKKIEKVEAKEGKKVSSINLEKNKTESKKVEKIEAKKADWEIPAWLVWNDVEKKSTEKTQEKKEIISEKKNIEPEKSSIKKSNPINEIKPKADTGKIEKKVSQAKTENIIKEVQTERIENKQNPWDMPSWLTWNDSDKPKTEPKKTEKVEDKKSENIINEVQPKSTQKLQKNEELKKVESKKTENFDYVEWLNKAESKPKTESNREEDLPDWLKWSFTEEKPKTEVRKEENKVKQVEKKENNSKKSDDSWLWNDWMEVPDWLNNQDK